LLNPISRYVMIGKLLAILGAVCIICWQSSQIHRWHKQFNSEHAAHENDRKAYELAQKEAHLNNHAHVQNIEQKSRSISDDERKSYLSDLAKLRASRLRSQGRTSQGAANGTGAPKAPAPAAGTDGNGLQVPPGGDVQADASEIELRLMHLQNWVREQLGLDPNAPEKPDAHKLADEVLNTEAPAK
jgi:hypothetical protein